MHWLLCLWGEELSPPNLTEKFKCDIFGGKIHTRQLWRENSKIHWLLCLWGEELSSPNLAHSTAAAVVVVAVVAVELALLQALGLLLAFAVHSVPLPSLFVDVAPHFHEL